MKRRWETEELVDHWTLLPAELDLLANKTGATRLGFALLLKSFQLEARFPARKQDLPGVAPAAPGLRALPRRGSRAASPGEVDRLVRSALRSADAHFCAGTVPRQAPGTVLTLEALLRPAALEDVVGAGSGRSAWTSSGPTPGRRAWPRCWPRSTSSSSCGRSACPTTCSPASRPRCSALTASVRPWRRRTSCATTPPRCV
jgi:hypothetical protein